MPEAARGWVSSLGQGISHAEAYSTFAEKPLRKGMGRIPVSTKRLNTLTPAMTENTIEKIEFCLSWRSRR